VFRVIHGERAEVLSFTTHADSGKMPGVLPSMGVGELVLGPINLIIGIKDAALNGQKIYSPQIEYRPAKPPIKWQTICRNIPPTKVGFLGTKRNRSNLPDDFV
jgi:hypothetical protein